MATVYTSIKCWDHDHYFYLLRKKDYCCGLHNLHLGLAGYEHSIPSISLRDPNFTVPPFNRAELLAMFLAALPYTVPGSPSFRLSVQGKVAELRQELNSGGKKDRNHSAKKIALKKIVANMTMSNNDMIGLFPDVVACMTISSLEIKKMWVIEGGHYGFWAING